MLCTGHADLRDRFARLALILDISILALSTWLVALAFVEPRISASLTPFGLKSQIWIGVLAVGTFFLTILQLKVDWKGQSEAHKRSLEVYAEVKREAGSLLASTDEPDQQANRRLLARYDIASTVGVAIPESEFLHQKQRHLTKIALSKYLDQHPFSSLWVARSKLWLRDNFKHEPTNDPTT
jgi:hypothetical protein